MGQKYEQFSLEQRCTIERYSRGQGEEKRVKQKYFLRFPGFHSDNRKSKIENRKWLGLFAIVVALMVCGARADAQQTGKIFRIGFLDSSTASGSAVLLEAFRR